MRQPRGRTISSDELFVSGENRAGLRLAFVRVEKEIPAPLPDRADASRRRARDQEPRWEAGTTLPGR